ncbi:MAG: polyprenyl synthetase family protein [Sphingomonadales bacterium]
MTAVSDQSDALFRAMRETAAAVDRRFNAVLLQSDGLEHRLMEATRYASIGAGKRLRPLLVVGSAQLFGVDLSSAIQVGTAVECIHTYSLIHDDLPAMDDDDLRRGKATVHKAYDDATAILAGDGLQALAFELLASEETHADPRVRVELVAALSRASGFGGMVGGQAIDIAAETESELDLGAITHLQRLKTGALIGFSVEAGGILGKADPYHREALRGYAQNVGLAFQIADDLLDVEGDPESVGKATQKDEEAGKATFVSLLGVDRARAQAKYLVEQALEHIEDFGEEASLLRGVARFVITRDK